MSGECDDVVDGGCLTESLTFFESYHPPSDISDVHKVCVSPDFEALELQDVRSGEKIRKLEANSKTRIDIRVGNGL